VEGVQPFHSGDRIFVVTGTYAGTYSGSTKLTVSARRPGGSIDPRFGRRGRAWVRAPWRGRDAALESIVSISKGSAKTIVIVAARYGGRQVQVIRLHL